MELEKTKLMNDLIDLYGCLLTPNQLEIMELYYMDDLSLGEIGENLGITRSAVFDTVKKSSAILEGYEEKLGLLNKERKKEEVISSISSLSNEELIEKIREL